MTRRGPFAFGDLVLLVDAKARRYLITLAEGREFHTHAGFVRHDELVGLDEGSVVRSSAGSRFTALRPTLSELDSFVRSEIAGYKVPRSLWLVDEVKRSPAGKPDYRWARSVVIP